MSGRPRHLLFAFVDLRFSPHPSPAKGGFAQEARLAQKLLNLHKNVERSHYIIRTSPTPEMNLRWDKGSNIEKPCPFPPRGATPKAYSGRLTFMLTLTIYVKRR